MVDILALAVSHGLLALAAWRLLSRVDLDAEGKDARRGPIRRAMQVRVADEDAVGEARNETGDA